MIMRLILVDKEALAPYIEVLRMPLRMWTHDDWTDREALRKTFHDHYAHIREIVPKENLLEWVPQDGYEPICTFLGKPVPEEPFPYINKGDSAAEMHKAIGYIRAVILLGQYLKKPVLFGAVSLGAWWYMRRVSK